MFKTVSRKLLALTGAALLSSGAAIAQTRSESLLVPSGGLYQDYTAKAAVKTNLLYWATTSPNLGFEFTLGRRWTFDATAVYNPWEWGGDGSTRFWLVQPEFRYWFCKAFERHFVGLHGIYGQYNMGNIEVPFTDVFDNYKYKGDAYGVGLSYGYHLPIGKRWGLEFTIGAGWVHLDYDKYSCTTCRTLVASEKKDYFGLTKAGISLVYIIR